MNKLSAIAIAVSFFAVCLFSDQCKAQPKNAGGQISLNGVELSYQHSTGDSVFVDVNAGIDFMDLLDGQTDTPGGKVRVTYNFIFFKKKYESGDLSLYAGPGVLIGYIRNKGIFGPVLGICGRFGLEFKFGSRPITFTADLMPALPAHMRSMGKYKSLDFFKDGLLYSLSPVLGIRYHF